MSCLCLEPGYRMGFFHAGKVLSAGSRWTLVADRERALLQVQIKSALPFCVLSMEKNQPKQMPSRSPFPVWCLAPQGKGWWEAFQGHQKQGPFWIYLMEIHFRTGDLPIFVLILRAGDEFLAVLAYSEIQLKQPNANRVKCRV